MPPSFGVPHPKWEERPLLVVVKATRRRSVQGSILAELAHKLAKWRLPDDVVFVASAADRNGKDIQTRAAIPFQRLQAGVSAV